MIIILYLIFSTCTMFTVSTFGFVLTVVSLFTINCNVIDNSIEKIVDSDGNCNLADELVTEIKNYQSTVNLIVENIVNGPFAGKTWERFELKII
jgi:hypothetical protein